MRGHASIRSSRSLTLLLTRRAPSRLTSIGLRGIQIQATPSSSSPASNQSQYADSTLHKSVSPDAEFEVLGAPFSLLSISLSASQNLYTRRGTLVAVSGKAENAISSLSLLEPIRRSLLGIPFLYQRITSTSPITALVSTKSALTSFAVVHLDGRLDWIVAQRNALLAWTGHSLSVKPKINTKLSLAHWGNSKVTGRGLVGLVGNGQIYQISLKTGEEYVVHPSNVVAYTQNQSPPQPYRFKSASLRFQIPTIDLSAWLPDSKFFQEMAKTQAWKAIAKALFNLRTWARRSIWGDRLFLQFQGPTTILLQTRGSRISDVLTDRDVNEIADTPTGAVQTVISQEARKENGHGSSSTPTAPVPPLEQPTKMQYVTVKSGKAEFKQP